DLGGKRWETNTTFFIQHESPDFWKSPDQFILENFKKSDHKIVKNTYSPFGGAIRICPGKNMAMVE
ncbi:12223_t:CDS:1, partial [Funneliformis caledonium]